MDYSQNWTTDKRYTPYRKWGKNYIKTLAKHVEKAPWRTNFHIQPSTGLLNDPNGFSFFNGKWHLFYQFFPFGPVHGLKSWFHLISDDLVHWKEDSIEILPNTTNTSHGVYSGSAIENNGKLNIFLTGNHRDQFNNRIPKQLSFTMDDKNNLSEEKVIINPDFTKHTEHFRDPQIIKFNNGFLLTIGAQDLNNQGQIATFYSTNLETFEPLGFLKLPNQNYGYMVECPNLIFIDEKPLLIFCPQGLDEKILNYQNIFPNTYYLGDNYDFKTNSFSTNSSLMLLDEGFDLYATQVFTAPDNRTLSISWLGLPDITYPSDKDGWSGVLSLVKELTIKNQHLYQYPVSEIKDLRTDKKTYHLTKNTLNIKTNNCYELELTIPKNEIATISLFKNQNYKTDLIINTFDFTAKLDRTTAGINFATKYGTIRTTTLPKEKIKLNIFVDESVIEIFFNDGYKTMSSRIFTKCKNQTELEISTKNHLDIFINYYQLAKIN